MNILCIVNLLVKRLSKPSQAFDVQTEFSLVFNFVILSYSRNSRKFDAREKYVFYSILCVCVVVVVDLKQLVRITLSHNKIIGECYTLF